MYNLKQEIDVSPDYYAITLYILDIDSLFAMRIYNILFVKYITHVANFPLYQEFACRRVD